MPRGGTLRSISSKAPLPMVYRSRSTEPHAAAQPPLKEIRAVARAIDVMDALCRAGACSLADLHRETSLSKSTLRRILLTLERGRFVRCSLADGRFRANVHVPTLEAAEESPVIARVLDAARPVLEEMATKVVWPTDLTARDGLHLRIVESNRSIIPLLVNRNEIGDRVDIANTAVGRAYIAFCGEKERADLLAGIGAAQGVRSVREIERVLPAIRARGYAERGAMHTGNTDRFPARNDRLSAVAMPIIHKRRVVCCMNLLWPRDITETLGGAPAMAKVLEAYVRKIERNLVDSR